MTEGFTHLVDVRYGECDQQGIVFNAHYLAYVDDAMDHWMRSLPSDAVGDSWTDGWDVMLKKVVIEWSGPARWRDHLMIRPRVQRWGTTSFDVRFDLRVDDRAIAEVLITYVSVDREGRPQPTPAAVRAAMDASSSDGS